MIFRKFHGFIKQFINFLKKLIYKILKFVALRFIFINFKFRILNIDKYTLLRLDDSQIKNLRLANNFEDIVKRIYILIKNNSFNIYLLEKFLFLLNYSLKRRFYLDYAEYYISKLDMDFNKLPNLFPYIVGPFTTVGDYRVADRLIFILRKKKDCFYRRQVGLYGERSHLTAIGHLCLFSYYLKSRELNYLGEDKSYFFYNKNKISNNLFFNLIKERAKKLNIKIKETDKKFNFFNQDDHEMELWPCLKKQKYYFARQLHGYVEEEWRKTYRSDQFFKLSDSLVKNAKDLMRFHNILQSKKWFVGIHLRDKKDKRTLRNGDLKNIKYICDQITSSGGEVVFTGTESFSELENRKNITFINQLNVSNSENELMQLYIWEYASFFIGNQSGGTHPPSLFGTPTIWVDVHPTVQARPPSTLDTVVPKRVFDLKNKKFLSFNESNSKKHFKCQTESEFLAKRAGYEIMPSDLQVIDEVLKFYFSSFVLKNTNIKHCLSQRDVFVPQEKGANYAL